MSVFTAGASDTNAKLVRSLAHSLKTSSPNCKPLLHHCCAQNAFSAISADDTEHFFNTATAVLSSSASEATIALSLQILYHALTTIPPYLLRPHWLHTTQKLTSVLKSSKSSESPRLHAKLLTVMASAVHSAAPFPLLQADMKSVVSKVCQSALLHALRALEPTLVTDYVCKAALCLIFAVLNTAPREIRLVLSQLEKGIRERWLFHHNSSVRSTAALLSAHLLVCHAQTTRAKLFEQRLIDACKQLDDIMNMIDMFDPSHAEKPSQLFDEALRQLSVSELQLRVSMVCSCIRHVLQLQQDVLMPMPLATLYRVLLRGIEERSVDAYASASGSLLLDTDGVFLLINTVMVECAQTIVSVTEASGKDAAVVFTHQIGQCFETRLSHVVLRSRTELGVISNLSERRLVYTMVAGMIEALGSGIIPYVSAMLKELFLVDVKLYIACCGRHALLVEGGCDGNEGNIRSRKRKRYQNDDGKHKTMGKSGVLQSRARPLNSLDEHCDRIAYAGKQTLKEALKCVVNIFECRGFMSVQVCGHVREMEVGIARLMKEGVLFDSVIHAANAAGLSGGCNRMFGEASELLIGGSKMCSSVLTGLGEAGLRREARRSRSGYESIIHARAPVLCVKKRLCEQPIEAKEGERMSRDNMADERDNVDGDEINAEIAKAWNDKDDGIKRSGESKVADATHDADEMNTDGNDKQVDRRMDMRDAGDGGKNGQDDTGRMDVNAADRDQGGTPGKEGDSDLRENDTNGGAREGDNGEHARDCESAEVGCANADGQRAENTAIDLQEQTHDGTTDAATCETLARGEDCVPPVSSEDGRTEQTPHDTPLAAGTGVVEDEDDDEEALIASLNFSPPDACTKDALDDLPT